MATLRFVQARRLARALRRQPTDHEIAILTRHEGRLAQLEDREERQARRKNIKERVATQEALPAAPPKFNKQAYIASKKWKLLRERVFEHYGRACQRCEATENLHVHHWTYDRLGNEDICDLGVLCADCHREHHRGTDLRVRRNFPKRPQWAYKEEKERRSWW